MNGGGGSESCERKPPDRNAASSHQLEIETGDTMSANPMPYGILLLAALVTLAACGDQPSIKAAGDAALPDRVVPHFPPESRHPVGVQPVVARSAMVVSDSKPASEAGLEILRRGDPCTLMLRAASIRGKPSDLAPFFHPVA
jgi:hypothetical protein